ncbi:MAG TPA: hypothetical protein VL625_10870 [Patescibacteria group bacterium]|nr:hypothetical protein [Patescibacteria group bacterium]
MSEQAAAPAAAEELVDEQEFEVQRCGGDVVVAFSQELELIERPKGGKGKPVLSGKKGHVFDEFELAQRIELLRQLGHENSTEKWALGELRRCAIGMGIPPKGYPEITIRDASRSAAENPAEKTVEAPQNWAAGLIKTMVNLGGR